MLLTSAQGDVRSRFGPVEIEALAQEAVLRHLAAASEKRVSLRFEAPATPLPVVEGDALLLQRAIHVLVDNAVCYTQEGGHVTILAARAARRLEFSIEDDGPGIAPEHRAHIFERFYRIDQSRSDRRHSGLGLSIAKEIAELHGGRLSFSPASPRGSRFTLALPFVNPHKR
jgi:signal transduction histidine kinase